MRISRTNTISHQHRCRLSCRWQRLREPQHFLQLQRDLHQLLRHQTLTLLSPLPTLHPSSFKTNNFQGRNYNTAKLTLTGGTGPLVLFITQTPIFAACRIQS